jgi:hypothetical protein
MMPIIGVKCDKFVTKSQAPTTPYGVPAFIVFLRLEQSKEKITKLPDLKYGLFEKKIG